MGMGGKLPVASVGSGGSFATFLLHWLQDAPRQRRRQVLLRHHRRQGAVLESREVQSFQLHRVTAGGGRGRKASPAAAGRGRSLSPTRGWRRPRCGRGARACFVGGGGAKVVVVALARCWWRRRLVSAAGGLKQLGQGVDVDLGHLQGLVLGQLLVVVEGRDNVAKLVEGVIQPVHPASLPGVGRQPPLLLHAVHLFAGRGALAAAAQLVYHHPAFQLAQLFPHFHRSRALAAATAAAPSHQLPSGVRLVPGRGGLGGTQLWGMEQVLGGACRADALQSGSQPGAWVGAVQEGQLGRVDRMLSCLQGRRRLGWRRLREVVRLGMAMVVPQLLHLSPLFCMQQAGHCTAEARRLRVGGGTGKQAQPKTPSRVSTAMSSFFFFPPPRPSPTHSEITHQVACNEASLVAEGAAPL